MEIKRLILMIVTIASATQVNIEASEASPFRHITCDNGGKITAAMNVTFHTAKVECGSSPPRYVPINNDTLNVINCTLGTSVAIHLFPDNHKKALGDILTQKNNTNIQRVNVTCSMSHVVVVKANVNTNGSDTDLKSVNVTYDPVVTMQIVTEGEANLTGPVIIGTDYKLKLTGPENYYLRVESCDAAPDDFFNKTVAHIYKNRQAEANYNVLVPFDDTATKLKTLDTILHGFGILDASVVHLRCTVDVCELRGCTDIVTTTSAIPPSATPKTHRRRRQVNNTVPKKRVTSKTSFRVQRTYFQANGSKGQIAVKGKFLFLAVALVFKIII